MDHAPAASSADWKIEHRADGSVIVRVPSCDRQGVPLPEAVFAFQPGNPQYQYWRDRADHRHPGVG